MNTQQPISAETARRGLKTTRDVCDVMSDLVADILGDRIDPARAAVAIKATETIVKAVEMEYRYQSLTEPRRPLPLTPEVKQLPVETEQPALTEIEQRLEASSEDQHKEKIRAKLEDNDIANKVLWTSLAAMPARRLTEAVIEVRRDIAKLPVDEAVETIVKSLNNKPAKKAPKRSIDEVLNGRDEGF